MEGGFTTTMITVTTTITITTSTTLTGAEEVELGEKCGGTWSHS